MDWLRLKGLDLYAYHGTEPWENQVGRRFVIDVELGVDLTASGQSDKIKDTVDYQRVYEAVRSVVKGSTFQLIERVGWRVMEELFARFEVQAVRVRVSKPEAPIGGLNECTQIEFHRTREEFNKQQGPC